MHVATTPLRISIKEIMLNHETKGLPMRTSKRNSALRRLRFEKHEERCMLTTMADVVFLVDESGTDTNTNTQAWLATIIDELDASFSAESVTVQYGLVGFGEGLTSNPRMAHSHLLGPVGSNGLWTSDYNHVVAAINNNLQNNGQADIEDGWDSIEHAIAEYDIREGSAPIFILVQGDEGREFVNETLTHDGIRRALDSKNAILNSVVAGALLYDGEPPTETVDEPIEPQNPNTVVTWAPIFDLTAYETTPGDFTDLYVLGVESDAADGVNDRQHDYVSFNTVTHITAND